MQEELLYQIALTLVPQIGAVQAKILLQHCEPEEIFRARKNFLEKLEGIGPVRAAAIRSFRDFHLAEKEISLIQQKKITPLFLTNPAYPKRLLNCYDSPTLLYQYGEADLNASRMAAIIGTRHNSEYGRQQTEKLVTELATAGVSIVSGLAYGIDAIAHRSALKKNLPTIGVLAHGLDQIYPSAHAGLAKEISQEKGALLTEFRLGTKPDKHNFPARNRIVAGMTDVTIVMETGIKGGSMITADLANGYNRDVFALPGKVTDPKSEGCNELIRSNRAQLFRDTADLLENLGWQSQTPKEKEKRIQRSLFIEMSPEEKIIAEILHDTMGMPVDEINQRSGLSSGQVARALLNLELQSVVLSLPGKLYCLA